MIKSSDFVARMERHWKENLNNASSHALREVWRQIADAFNSRIAASQNSFEDAKWTILQPPTGSGKSQGTMIYCCMLAELPKRDHPGVIIVVRQISSADAMAQAINLHRGAGSAAAYHSESALGLGELSSYPVLVITHKAYLNAMDRVGRGDYRQTWPVFHEWCNGSRKLVVVDEALDIIEGAEVTLDELRHTLGVIPEAIRKEHRDAIYALNKVIAVLETKKLFADQGLVQRESIVPEDIEKADLAPLREALRPVRFDHMHHRIALEESSREFKLHDKRLQGVQNLINSWSIYSQVGQRHTLTSARLLVPDNFKGCVVLDATASSNLVYSLFERAMPVQPPPGVRNYSSVTLHVSRGHNVGKVAMRQKGPEVANDLIANLNPMLNGRRVFFCCHKDTEQHVLGLETTFEIKSGHWGAVDGSNAWQDFDTAVIFGLPYRPDSWSATTFFALQGVRDDTWLNSKERPWEKHRDVRMALRTGQLVTEMVQAINRIRCRKVIDEHGNCASCDVYLLLPSGKIVDAIMEGISIQMPGIIVRDWEIATNRRKPRKSNQEEAFVKFLEAMQPGCQSVSSVRDQLGISPKTFERHLSHCRVHDSRISQVMDRCGVRYEVRGKGRGAKSVFVRD
jgi:hypothetical protein